MTEGFFACSGVFDSFAFLGALQALFASSAPCHLFRNYGTPKSWNEYRGMNIRKRVSQRKKRGR